MLLKTSKHTNPWDKLDKILSYEQEPMGTEWFTAQDLCNRYGYSERTSHSKLQALVKKKQVEVWKGYCKSIKHTVSKYKIIK
jgi:hypothetical protein